MPKIPESTKCKHRPKESNLILCWSGEIGRLVSAELKEWLCEVDSDFKPFHSDDIPKGDYWELVLREKLADVRAAIVCITPGTIGSPWVHYEAGHLAGRLKHQKASGSGRVFPFLFRVDKSRLAGPLTAFQATVPTASDVGLLLESLAKLLKTKPPRGEDAWKKLEERLATIPYEGMGEIFPGLERLFRRKTFDEPVHECLSQRWKERWAAARVTLARLEDRREDVEKRAAPYVAERYDDLIKTLDYYADAMASELLREESFEISDKSLNLPTRVSEDRRRKVGCSLLRVLEPLPPPVLEPQARLYEKYSLGCEDSGAHLWQGIEAQLIRRDLGDLRIKEKDLEECSTSAWAFDRIVSYIAIAREVFTPAESALVQAIEREFEIIENWPQSGGTPPDLRPLHFALWALEKRPQIGRARQEVQQLLKRVHEYGRDLSEVSPDEAPLRLAKGLVEKVERVRASLFDRRRKGAKNE